MEDTDHVFVVGEGAEKLARLHKIPRTGPISKQRLKYYNDQKKLLLPNLVLQRFNGYRRLARWML